MQISVLQKDIHFTRHFGGQNERRRWVQKRNRKRNWDLPASGALHSHQ